MSLAPAAICHRFQAEPPGYRRRRPETTVLYQVDARELQTFLSRVAQRDGPGLPTFVRRELAALLDCGSLLARGFARVRCQGCGDDLLVAFSCKGRGICRGLFLSMPCTVIAAAVAGRSRR